MFSTLSFLSCVLAVALASPSPSSDSCYEPFPYGNFPTGIPRPTGLPSGWPPAPFPKASYGAPFPTFNISSVVVGPTGTGSSSVFVPSSSDEGRSGSLSSPSATASPTSMVSNSALFPNTTASPTESVTAIYSETTAVTTVISTVYLTSPSPESSSNVISPAASSSFSSSANVTTISSFVTGTVIVTTTLTPSSPESPVTAINSTLLPGTAISSSMGTGGASMTGNRTSSAASFNWSPYVPYIPGTEVYGGSTPSSSPDSPVTASVTNSSSAYASPTHVTIHLNS
ncbi:hypothetical protein KCU82_g9152, partial [Aureobasidium melanogenum]